MIIGIIGIVGFLNSGKGTVGDMLVKHYSFKQDSFAKPLKDAVSTIFGWDRDMLEGDTEESRKWREEPDKFWSEVCETEITPRLALQLFGTESIRDVFHQDFWCASLAKRYRESNMDTVVTDCRFQNEIETIWNIGGQVWRVKRGPEPDWYKDYLDLKNEKNFYMIEKLREDNVIPHRSETDWIGSKFNQVIENDGTLANLKEKVDNLMSMDQVINLNIGA